MGHLTPDMEDSAKTDAKGLDLASVLRIPSDGMEELSAIVSTSSTPVEE
jgi:hypothetical protein